MSSAASNSAFEQVRLGIVGVGAFGRRHAQTVAALHEARLAALVDSNAGALAEARQLCGEVPCWNSLDAALAEADAEAWIVATSTATHVQVAGRLLERGHPVLLEKPLALSAAEAERLTPLVRADSANLMLGHVVLFNSEFTALVGEAARRGPVRWIDAVRHRPTWQARHFAAEGPFRLLMVHDLYQVQVLTGGREPTAFHARLGRGAEGLADLALAELAWSDGAVARLSASFLATTGMPDDGFDRLELFGDGWVARLAPNPRPIELWDDKARWPLALEINLGARGSAGMLAEEIRCFCRVVRGEQAVPPGATFHDALQVQRWLERLMEDADAC